MNRLLGIQQLASFLLFISLLNGTSLILANGPVITALTLTPDGKQVVATQDHRLLFYDLETLNQQTMVECDLAKIHDVHFSPDGKSLAIAGGNPGETGVVQLSHYPFEYAEVTHEIHDDSVYAIRWLSDSQRLLSASIDGTVCLFDLKKNEVIRKFPGHSKGVSAIELLPDEVMFATASVDQSLRVWNIQSGENVRTFNNHIGAIHDLKIRPLNNGLPLVVTVADDRTVRLWQPTIGRMVRFVKLDSIPLAAVWHPSKPLIVVTTSTGKVLVIDAQTTSIQQQVQTRQPWLHAIAIDPEGEFVFVANATGLRKISLKTSPQ